jgi:ribosomal protein S17
MSSLWNILSPIRSGIIKINGSGHELFGTVIKHGINDKTVTVRVSAQHWNFKYKKYEYSHKNKQVHDSYNYCVTGDKVIIRATQKLTPTKAYYVKNIVKPFARGDYDLRAPERTVNTNVAAP